MKQRVSFPVLLPLWLGLGAILSAQVQQCPVCWVGFCDGLQVTLDLETLKADAQYEGSACEPSFGSGGSGGIAFFPLAPGHSVRTGGRLDSGQ